MRNTRSICVMLCLVLVIIKTNGAMAKNNNEEVLLVSPVLAPYNNSRAKTETAKDFPLLMLLATDKTPNNSKLEAKEEHGNEQTTYHNKIMSPASLLEAPRHSRTKTEDAKEFPDHKTESSTYKIAHNTNDQTNTDSVHDQPIYIQKLQSKDGSI